MRKLIERADKTKMQRARERRAAFRTAGIPFGRPSWNRKRYLETNAETEPEVI